MRFQIRASLVACALAALVATPVAARAQAPRLAYVDVATLMEQAPGRAEAVKAFEGEAAQIRAEQQRMSDSLDAAVGAYQKGQATMTAAAKATKEKQLQEMQAGFQQRAQELEQRGQARQTELSQQFESLVRDAINDVRTADGYAMVFASGSSSAMLAADKSLDITDKVMTRMRTLAASRPATTPNRPGAAPASPAPSTGAPVAAPAGATRPKVP